MLQSEALQLLEERIAVCDRCTSLCEYRRENSYRTVPGEGMPNARLMFLGEAPGENEAKEGRPFVGKSGRLLTSIIEGCGWKRSEVFIANILKCRPPKNRDPEGVEASNCRKFLDIQLKVINPEWIVCLGRVASIRLLQTEPERSMNSFRGKVHEYQGRKVVCTFHPSFLLRQPQAKQDVWEDLQPVRDAIAGIA